MNKDYLNNLKEYYEKYYAVHQLTINAFEELSKKAEKEIKALNKQQKLLKEDIAEFESLADNRFELRFNFPFRKVTLIFRCYYGVAKNNDNIPTGIIMVYFRKGSSEGIRPLERIFISSNGKDYNLQLDRDLSLYPYEKTFSLDKLIERYFNIPMLENRYWIRTKDLLYDIREYPLIIDDISTPGMFNISYEDNFDLPKRREEKIIKEEVKKVEKIKEDKKEKEEEKT